MRQLGLLLYFVIIRLEFVVGWMLIEYFRYSFA